MIKNIGIDDRLFIRIKEKLQQKNTTAHVTFDRSERYLNEIRNNDLLLELIYKIYYLDFLWFNFKLE